MTNINEQIVTQAEAARRRAAHTGKTCSRQLIGQLVKAGRLNVPKDGTGREISGMVYLHEVLNLKPAKRGRPRYPEGYRPKPVQTGHGFTVGDRVVWSARPSRGGHGHTLPIPAAVSQIGTRRVRIEYLEIKKREGASAERKSWVRPDELNHLDRTKQEALEALRATQLVQALEQSSEVSFSGEAASHTIENEVVDVEEAV